MNPTQQAVTIFNDKGSLFSSIRIDKIATGFQFTEGPVWHPDQYLLFSDIPANLIWQIFPDGIIRHYMDNSGLLSNDTSLLSDMIGSNALAIDQQGNLIICQHGNHGISKLDKNGVISVLTSSYKGRPYNSPNDIVIRKSDGSIYFSDPPYGLKEQVLHPDTFQPHAGVYRYKDGEVTLLSDKFNYPNGVCLSPDESYLYVSSNHPDEAFLWRYSLSPSGEVTDKIILTEQNADGIKTDQSGNLFLCTDNGILILSPQGEKLALLPVPESPTNIAWVNPGYNQLYITARSSIYLATGFSS